MVKIKKQATITFTNTETGTQYSQKYALGDDFYLYEPSTQHYYHSQSTIEKFAILFIRDNIPLIYKKMINQRNKKMMPFRFRQYLMKIFFDKSPSLHEAQSNYYLVSPRRYIPSYKKRGGW